MKDLFPEVTHMIHNAFIELHDGNSAEEFPEYLSNIRMERMPYPEYDKDDFLYTIRGPFPLLVLLAFIVIGQQSAKSVAIEKETHLKEYMLMMGLSRTVLWTSWFVFYSIISLVGVVMVTIIFCCDLSPNGPILKHSNCFLVFIFLLIWSFSAVALQSQQGGL